MNLKYAKLQDVLFSHELENIKKNLYTEITSRLTHLAWIELANIGLYLSPTGLSDSEIEQIQKMPLEICAIFILRKRAEEKGLIID